MGQSYKVAVIGAGPAGLVTARELQREGHRVTVFEKANKVGGVWLYNPRVETDPLGLDPNREIVHSSLHKSLRVNAPRQTMSFLDYPFLKKEGGDPRPFPGHEEVLRFLQDFARDFGLMELIRFGHEVVRVELVDEVTHEWIVESRTRETESTWEPKEEVFEAVVICNGNYTEPNIAEFPGRDTWPGLQMHSHNYRTPEQFENKMVVLIGSGPSAIDIMKEIVPLAKQVHQAVRTHKLQSLRVGKYNNAWKHSMIECAHKDGRVVFQDGSTVDADVIIHCTGYKYHYPFLNSNGIVTVENNRVRPLYKHVFPPKLAPWLSFVGLNYRAVVFRVMELQAKWVAKVLSGTVELPSQEAMACSVGEIEKTGLPEHHTHSLQNHEVEYVSWVAAQVDIKPPESWKEITFYSMLKWVIHHGGNYRDTWDVDNWIQEIESSNSTLGPSAVDILKEIPLLQKQVHQDVRTPSFRLIRGGIYDNVWQHSMIECAHKDGKVEFQDGTIVDADVIIQCTGYKYHYPFLKSNGVVTVDDNRVGPLYKHVFPPSLAPWLSFVGLNYRVVIFKVMELQAKWVAKALSDTVELPSQYAMVSSVEELYSKKEKAGVPKHHIHSLQNDEVSAFNFHGRMNDLYTWICRVLLN